jgi:hypothetical protein
MLAISQGYARYVLVQDRNMGSALLRTSHAHLKYAYEVAPELVHKRGVGEVASSHGVGTSAVSTGRFAEERAH